MYQIDLQWKNFMLILTPIFNHCFQYKTLNSNYKKTEYNNAEIETCKQELDVLLILSRFDNRHTDAYRAKKRQYNSMLARSRSLQYKNRIFNSNGKSKCFWQIVGEIKNNGKGNGDCQIPGDPNDICNNFVLSAAPNLLSSLPQQNKFSCSIPFNNKSFFLWPITITQVLKIIDKLKK